MTTTNSEDDENIFIDCNPVTYFGSEEISTDNENRNIPINRIDNITIPSALSGLADNTGIQIVIGLVLFGVLYGFGNFVFKQTPNNIINNKLENY